MLEIRPPSCDERDFGQQFCWSEAVQPRLIGRPSPMGAHTLTDAAIKHGEEVHWQYLGDCKLNPWITHIRASCRGLCVVVHLTNAAVWDGTSHIQTRGRQSSREALGGETMAGLASFETSEVPG